MWDDLSSVSLHVQQLRRYMNEDMFETVSSLGIDLDMELSTIDHDLKELQSKYVGKRVSKDFNDVDRGGDVRPYKDSCTDAFYSREDGHYLFHVSYDSDSDSEDIEQWEISKCLE